MSRLIDLTGLRFGHLVVLAVSHRKVLKGGGTLVFWSCRCDCGRVKAVRSQPLRSGLAQSCGCLARKMTGDRRRTHGMSGSPTYRSWTAMRERCANPNNSHFVNYGGRGIRVCDRWSTFENFLADMGERPAGYTLERSDVNGNYEPKNCVWLPASQQCENTTRSRLVEYEGETKILRDWARTIGITPRALGIRLAKYPVDVAMTLRRYEKKVSV